MAKESYEPAPTADDDGTAEMELLADLDRVDLELLVAWITDGPPRPPESLGEVEEWARTRSK